VQALTGSELQIERLPSRPGDQLFTHAHIAKARRVLGYSPMTSLRDGLAQEITWYQNRVLPASG
jgi:UDP-glucuronate 4-epimerase